MKTMTFDTAFFRSRTTAKKPSYSLLILGLFASTLLYACSQGTSSDITYQTAALPAPHETPDPLGNPGGDAPFTLTGPVVRPEQPAGVVSGTIALGAGVTGSVNQVEFYVNNILIGVGLKPQYAFSLDTNDYSSPISVKVRAVSTKNEVKETPELDFDIDNEAPIINSITVASGNPANPAGVISGLSTFTVAATDPSGIANVVFKLNDTIVGTANAAPFALSLDTTALQNGPYNLVVEVRDATAVGNSTVSSARAVFIDNGGATIVITTPADGQRINGLVQVRATASDPSGVTALVFISPVGITDTNPSPTVFEGSFNTTIAPEGPLAFTARATNNAGKYSFKTVTPAIDNTPLDQLIEILPPVFTGADFGASVAIVEDTNGDGFDDVVLGSPNADRTAINEGLAMVARGPDFLTHVVVSNPVPELNARFGSSVAGIGDVDGDGNGDIAVSAPTASVDGVTNTGKVFILYGPDFSRFLEIKNPDKQAGEEFGHVVVGGGDLTGDGVEDILVTAPKYNANATTLLRSGRAYVVQGPAFTTFRLVANPDAQFDCRFGETAVILGDVNNDLKLDYAIGVPNFDGLKPNGTVDPARQNMGRAFIFNGPATLNKTLNDPTPENSGHFGQGLGAAGDINDDGRADLAISAPGADGERGEVFYALAPGFTLSAPMTRTSPVLGDAFGISVTGNFDANGDGKVDLAVGSSGADDVIVYFGPAFTTKLSLLYPHGYIGIDFGGSMQGGADVNNDGFDDLIIGASGLWPNGGALVVVNP